MFFEIWKKNTYSRTLLRLPPSVRLRNDLYCVEWDVKPYYTIPYLAAYAGTIGVYSRRDGQAELTWVAGNVPRGTPIPALTVLAVK